MRGEHSAFASSVKHEYPGLSWPEIMREASERWRTMTENDRDEWREHRQQQNEQEVEESENAEENEADGQENVEENEADGQENVEEMEVAGQENVEENEADGQENVEEMEVAGQENVEENEADGQENVEEMEVAGQENVEEMEVTGPEKAFFDHPNCWKILLDRRNDFSVPMEKDEHYAERVKWVQESKQPNKELYLYWVKNLERRIPFLHFLSLEDGHGVHEGIVNYFIGEQCYNKEKIRYIAAWQSDEWLNKGKEFKCTWNLDGVEQVYAPFKLSYGNNVPGHWALEVIDFVKKEINVYDSANRGTLPQLKTAIAWNIYAMLETKGWNVPKRDAFEMTVDMKCPQQSDDSVDCGLFVMMYAKDLIEKKDWSYKQNTIAPFRRIVANWIFEKAGLK